MPERFTPAFWRDLLRRRQATLVGRPLFPALSSLPRPFCLSVSGAVAPSAVGLEYPLSPAGIDRLCRASAVRTGRRSTANGRKGGDCRKSNRDRPAYAF